VANDRQTDRTTVTAVVRATALRDRLGMMGDTMSVIASGSFRYRLAD
jgi:hypothetical protein